MIQHNFPIRLTTTVNQQLHCSALCDRLAIDTTLRAALGLKLPMT